MEGISKLSSDGSKNVTLLVACLETESINVDLK